LADVEDVRPLVAGVRRGRADPADQGAWVASPLREPPVAGPLHQADRPVRLQEGGHRAAHRETVGVDGGHLGAAGLAVHEGVPGGAGGGQVHHRLHGARRQVVTVAGVRPTRAARPAWWYARSGTTALTTSTVTSGRSNGYGSSQSTPARRTPT